MDRIKAIFAVVLVFIGFAVSVSAEIPRLSGYVTDQTGALSPNTKRQLEAVSQQLDEAAKVQVVTAIVNSLDGMTVEDYAEKLFRANGIGDKAKDQGVLILVAPNQRKVRIEVGYGLEGLIPDGKAGQIIDDNILPSFKKGNIESGVIGGHMRVARIIADEYKVPLKTNIREQVPNKRNNPLVAIILLIALMTILGGGRSVFPWIILGGLGGGGFGDRRGDGFGGFGGFGGGMSGGGGASRGW